MNKLFTFFLSACFFGLNAQSVVIDSDSDKRFDYSEKKEVKSFKGEVQTRPISLLQGIYTAGMEFKIAQNTSILFDLGAGTSLFDESTLTTGMLGIRYYIGFKEEADNLAGSYLSFRHRSRWYEDPFTNLAGEELGTYGANTNFMIGRKWVFGPSEQISAAAEIGAGRQTWPGATLLLPTWAVTLGFRF
tara:strand:+ start:181 stop:747 length:567 start_codon:yes stop_codon:yes gene_type:complete